MQFGVKKKELTGWRHEGWRSCKDVDIPGVIEGVPRYLRCMRCTNGRLMTHGETRFGGCICGFRKLNPAFSLTWTEILLLKLGWFRLDDWERQDIRPLMPVLHRLRMRLFRPHLMVVDGPR